MGSTFSLEIPLQDTDKLSSLIEERCAARIAANEVYESDVANIRDRKLDLIPKNLYVDPMKLEKLRRLCQLWEVDIRVGEITSHRKIIGPIIVQVKKILFPIIRFILKDLIREQRDFNAASIQLFAELCNEHTAGKAAKNDR